VYSSTARVESGREVWVYVATDAAVKFTVLKIRNDSGAAPPLARLCGVGAGRHEAQSVMHVVTEVDPAGGTNSGRGKCLQTEFAETGSVLRTSEPGPNGDG